jgi:hypothetical protein
MKWKLMSRKKYRAGQTYFYLVSGIKHHSSYQTATFNIGGTLTLKNDLDPVEMYNEVMFFVKKEAELTEEYGNYAIYSYHVESY